MDRISSTWICTALVSPCYDALLRRQTYSLGNAVGGVSYGFWEDQAIDPKPSLHSIIAPVIIGLVRFCMVFRRHVRQL